MIKPQPLQVGDTVATLSLSSAAANAFPHIYKKGKETLESLGLRVKEFPLTLADAETLSKNPEKRAADLNAAILDPEVKAIISVIGGDDSVRILDYIDYEAALANPKIMLGYSDSTTWLGALASKGLVTYYGPAVMAGFAQAKNLDEKFMEHVKKMLFTNYAGYEYPKYEYYHEGYPDWADPSRAGQVKPRMQDGGAKWINGNQMQGQVWGGCLSVLEMMKATKHFPKKEFFEGKILLLETSEDVPHPRYIKYFLRGLAAAGKLEKLQGIMMGRGRGYDAKMKEERAKGVLQAIQECGREDMPVIVDMPIGHTDPNYIVPMGVEVKVDALGTFRINEYSTHI